MAYSLCMASFTTHNPVNGAPIREHHIFEKDEIADALALSQAATSLWSEMGFRARKKV